MATQYVWKHGGFHVDAQVVGERLEVLQQAYDNRLTPRIVLDDARRPRSPLHPCFEWDDVRAAELHREQQARQLISRIRIVQPASSEGPQRMVRAYVNLIDTVGADYQQSYRPMATVLADDGLRAQMLLQARADMKRWIERYGEFEELARLGIAVLAEIEMLAHREVPHEARP